VPHPLKLAVVEEAINMTRTLVRFGAHLFAIATVFTGSLALAGITTAQQVNVSTGDDPVKLRVNMINLNIEVLDQEGRYVRGLTKDNFEIYEDKTKQSIDLFSFDDQPISIGFIFDLSGSMTGKVVRARETLREFENGCNIDDEMFLIGFNEKPSLLADFTKDDSEIVNSVAMMPTKGSTSLYDAVYMGVEKLKQGRYNRKVLIIISDGQDNSSHYTQKEIKNLVRESDVEIFSVGTTEIWQSAAFSDMEGMEILDDISTMTGGKAYFPQNFDQMARVCRQIALGLRNQYSIAYVPSNASFDGSWRKLKVKIKGIKDSGRFVLRARTGYYARQ
jgi:Ca-activated chloride channel family protein